MFFSVFTLRKIWLFFAIISSNVIIAQENYFLKRFTTENGLPHNNVKSIVRDLTGFLWIGTWDGLSRYDGYEFKNYYHIPGDTASIPYFTILKVCVDKENHVWISTEMNGLCRYNRTTDNFKRFYLPGVNQEGAGIADIEVNARNELFVCCKSGVYKYDNERSGFVKFKLANEKGIDTLLLGKIIFDNKGSLWLINEELFKFRIDYQKKEIVLIKKYPYGPNKTLQEKQASMRGHLSIFADDKENIRLQLNGGLYIWDRLTNQFVEYKRNIHSLPFRPSAPFYIKGSGLYFLNNTGKLSFIPSSDCYEPETIYTDNNGNVWYGDKTASLAGKGLIRVSGTPGIFRHPLKAISDPQKPFSIFAIHKDKDGNVWTNSKGFNCIFRIKKKGTITKFKPVPDRLSDADMNVRAILEDSSGIWFGYNQPLLVRYSKATNQFKQVYYQKSFEKETDRPMRIHALLAGEKGKIIIGAYGIFLFDPKTNQLAKVFKTDNVNVLYSLAKQNDNIWVVKSTNELLLLDRNFKLSRSYSLIKERFNLEYLCTGDEKDLWLTSLGCGLFHFYPGNGKVENYTTANGLSNNTTYSVLKDKSGNLWITTNHGISRLNPRTRQFRNFGLTDGLEIEEFNSDAVFQAPDGEMLFGGMNGIVRFYPDSLNQLPNPTYRNNLVFTDFKVDGSSRYFEKPVYESDTVVLMKGDNNFTTTFSALELKDPENIRYRHIMVGYDHDWVQGDFRNRTVTYNNLKPGKYLVKIQSSGIMEEWTYSRTLVIVIPPYFYETLGFKILLSLFILGILASIIWIYLRQLNLANRNIQNQLKLESLRGQMNPHFIFNSLNSINYFISQNDRLSANRYISDFSKLIRSILQNMSAEFIPLTNEIESLQDYLNLEHFRFEDKFKYDLLVDPCIDLENCLVFPGMIQPFIENAIWHGVRALQGRKGHITITFRTTSPVFLLCIVEDDGVGRKMAAEGKSNGRNKSRGIGIAKERLKIYNSQHHTNLQITIEDIYPDQQETGTRVTLEVPVK